MTNAENAQICNCTTVSLKFTKIDLVLFLQGKTHTLKPGAKDHVLAMAKGQPAQPMEDISMRIYLCEGLLGMSCSLLPLLDNI